MYEYKISNVRVIDGDTIECNIDLGFNVCIRGRLRYKDIDTPELRDKDEIKKYKAQESKQYVIDWFSKNPVAYILSYKADGFGRWLAKIYASELDLQNKIDELGRVLVEEGLALIWSRN